MKRWLRHGLLLIVIVAFCSIYVKADAALYEVPKENEYNVIVITKQKRTKEEKEDIKEYLEILENVWKARDVMIFDKLFYCEELDAVVADLIYEGMSDELWPYYKKDEEFLHKEKEWDKKVISAYFEENDIVELGIGGANIIIRKFTNDRTFMYCVIDNKLILSDITDGRK